MAQKDDIKLIAKRLNLLTTILIRGLEERLNKATEDKFQAECKVLFKEPRIKGLLIKVSADVYRKLFFAYDNYSNDLLDVHGDIFCELVIELYKEHTNIVVDEILIGCIKSANTIINYDMLKK